MDSKGHSVVITSFLPSQRVAMGNNEASHWLNSYTSSNNGGGGNLGEWLHAIQHHQKQTSHIIDPLSLGQLTHFQIHSSANT